MNIKVGEDREMIWILITFEFRRQLKLKPYYTLHFRYNTALQILLISGQNSDNDIMYIITIQTRSRYSNSVTINYGSL